MSVIKPEVHPIAPNKERKLMFTDDTLDEAREIRKVFLAVAEERLPDSSPDGFTVLGDIKDTRLQKLWVLEKSKTQQLESWVKPDRGPSEFTVTKEELAKLEKELAFLRRLFWLELQMIYPQLDTIGLCPFTMIKGWKIAVKRLEHDPVDEMA